MFTNSKTKWMIYKELELIPDSVPEPQLTYPDDRLSWLTQIWRKLTNTFTSNYEPKISQVMDDSGEFGWHVYDPISAHTFYMASEAEVLIWLDEYYGVG